MASRMQGRGGIALAVVATAFAGCGSAPHSTASVHRDTAQEAIARLQALGYTEVSARSSPINPRWGREVAIYRNGSLRVAVIQTRPWSSTEPPPSRFSNPFPNPYLETWASGTVELVADADSPEALAAAKGQWERLLSAMGANVAAAQGLGKEP
jgi:hypothetical protein